MVFLCAAILYLIAAILGFWSASLLWRAWHAWRLQRRGKRVYSPARRRFGVSVALATLPVAGFAFALGEIVRTGRIDSTIEPLPLAAQSVGAMMLFLAISALYVAFRFDPSNGRRRCSRCWYDMSATQGRRCSECGHESPDEKGMFRTRRAPRLVVVSLIFIALSYATYVTPSVITGGWPAVVPTTAVIIGLPWWPDRYIDNSPFSLVYRAREKQLWGWQKSLLRWRVNRIIRRSEDLDLLGRAGLVMGGVFYEWTPEARLNPAAQIVFLDAFRADMKAGTGILRNGVMYSLNLLPDTLAPEAVSDALPGVTSALTGANGRDVHWGLTIAPKLGRDGISLTPHLIAIAENQSLWTHTRLQALTGLSIFGEWDDAAWAAYLRGFDANDVQLRTEVVRLSTSLRRNDERLREKLAAAVNDPVDEIAGIAAAALLKLSPSPCDAVPALAPVMRRPSTVRIIIELAQKCPCPEVVEGIRAILDRHLGHEDYAAFVAASQVGAYGEPLLPLLRQRRDNADVSSAHTEQLHLAIAAIEAAVKAKALPVFSTSKPQ